MFPQRTTSAVHFMYRGYSTIKNKDALEIYFWMPSEKNTNNVSSSEFARSLAAKLKEWKSNTKYFGSVIAGCRCFVQYCECIWKWMYTCAITKYLWNVQRKNRHVTCLCSTRAQHKRDIITLLGNVHSKVFVYCSWVLRLQLSLQHIQWWKNKNRWI